MIVNEDILKLKKRIFFKKLDFKPSISLRYPNLVPLILFWRRYMWHVRMLRSQFLFATKKEMVTYPKVISRHTSPLYRKLSNVDQNKIEGKIINLTIASQKLNGLIIKKGETFSLWKIIGNPTYKKGYKDGLLLSGGDVIYGVGGGLCQLSNLLTWLFLHSNLTITERHHHSFDAFPDSGRTIPFGTGSTIYFPTLDLKCKNTSESDVQLEVWLTDTQLCGKIRSMKSSLVKYHIYAEDEVFFTAGNEIYRHNKVYRDIISNSKIVKKELIGENTFLVKYKVDNEKLYDFMVK